MFNAKNKLFAHVSLVISLAFSYGSLKAQDSYSPEITARVVRISVLKGDASVRRGESTEWERATLNLPLAEGDEISLERGARMEIQLDSRNYLRVGEGGHFKLTTLQDDGVVVTLFSGAALLKIGSFQSSGNFFEIDATRTTVAVKATGLYRIDVGDGEFDQVSLAVGDGGEARIYSDQSGFTVRNGRGAVLYLSGDRAGEWETFSAQFSDSLSRWSADRDSSIARKLKNSYYGRYYDYDQYGAEDLSDHGQWINTSQYGYVWRPYSSVTSTYQDWSPYRYGHWRWFPPYGWTWVNDEPWGWATYHHGRWIYLPGGWYWSPYSSYRWSRSWWRPAFVTIAVYDGRVCWYPLGYYSPYYDYNHYYYSQGNWGRGGGGGGDRDDDRDGDRTAGKIPPSPNVGPGPKKDPIDRVPPSGVVAVDAKDFGRTRDGIRSVPADFANQIINGKRTGGGFGSLADAVPGGRKIGDSTVIPAPVRRIGPPQRTGAGERIGGSPLDSQLEKSVIFQDRLPARKPPAVNNGAKGGTEGDRRPGAIDRSGTPSGGGRFDSKPVERRPVDSSKGGSTNTGSAGSTGGAAPESRFDRKPIDRSTGSDRNGGTVTVPTLPRNETPVRNNPPERKYEPPVRSTPPTPRNDPPARSNPPERKYEPPVRSTPPAPRNDPPARSNPPARSEPPARSAPPPKSGAPSRSTPPSSGGSADKQAPPKK